MNLLHRFIVAAAVAGIFASGFATGWLVNDRRVSPPVVTDSDPAGGRSGSQAAASVLAELREHLKLSPEQDVVIAQLLKSWEAEAIEIDQRRLDEKIALFRKLTPQIRQHLSAEQQELFDRVVERTSGKQRQRQSSINHRGDSL